METQASPSPHFLFLCTLQWFHYGTLTLDCRGNQRPQEAPGLISMGCVVWHFFHSIVQDWVVIIMWHAGLMWLSFVTDTRWIQGSGLLSIHHQPLGFELNVWVCLWALDHLQSTAAGQEVVAGVLMCPLVTRIPSLLWVCDICEELIWRWWLPHFSMGPSDKCSLSFTIIWWCHVHSLHKWDHCSCSKDSILSCPLFWWWYVECRVCSTWRKFPF